MFVTAGAAFIDEMGYSMSRLDIESNFSDCGTTVLKAGNDQRSKNPSQIVDHEIVHLTKLRTRPHEHVSHDVPGKRKLPVSTVKMLAGRECNLSGRGRFSSADRCHMLSRYLPVNGPSLVDQMTSRAYVSKFSTDGSLFVAGFQV